MEILQGFITLISQPAPECSTRIGTIHYRRGAVVCLAVLLLSLVLFVVQTNIAEGGKDRPHNDVFTNSQTLLLPRAHS